MPAAQHDVRSASVDDPIGIAEVHVDRRWELATPGRLVQVAPDDAGHVVGFVHTDADRDGDADAAPRWPG